MYKFKAVLITMVVLFASALGLAQDDYFANYFKVSDQMKESQPHWVTPVATVTPRLEQEVRYDQFWQVSNAGVTTNNYDGGKGLELIPMKNVEVIFNVPPYIDHNSPKAANGWGDMAFLVKYRLLSGNEHNGNYILTAFLGWSLPTGTNNNGKSDPIITPTIAYGKGFGHFDAQGTFGAALPTGNTGTLGRNYLWNNAFQYRLFKKLWPEVEVNTTWFQQGPHDGQVQNFITPGLVIGRLPLAGRTGLTFGGGFQIATSQFHLNNHNGILTVRIPF